MWHVGDGMAWWMLFWTLFELLVVIAVVVLVAHFLKAHRTDQTAGSSDDPPQLAGT